MGENSCKRNYFIDVKHSMENLNTTDLHRFSWIGKTVHTQENCRKISFKQLGITEDISNKTSRFAESK